MEKLEEFFKASPLAKEIFSKNYTVMKVYDGGVPYGNQCSFHPNGKCGCIELHDECLIEGVDIRCNHLMWCEGWIEAADAFDEWTEDTDAFDGKAILLYGNNKGSLEAVIVY